MKEVLTNNNLARIFHEPLYQRMIAFGQQYTPEFPIEPIVEEWLKRLYAGDTKLHILVTYTNGGMLNGHAVIDVQEHYGYRVVYCHQAQVDKGSEGSIDEFVEYIDKLRSLTNAYCSIFTVAKHIKGLEKKYGYKTTRATMIKYGETDEDNS